MAEQRNALYVEGRDNPVMRTLELKPSDNAGSLELMNATPANMPKTNPLPTTNVDDMNVRPEAKGLYVDPSPIYQGSIDFIQRQRDLSNERYAQNKADIANIFGNLTQVNKESQDRVTKQYTESIANQQMATAKRIAEERTGQALSQESAMRAASERGGGPMANLAESPLNLQTQRGISDINKYSTVWEGMQGAIGQQTQQNLQANLAALGQQEVMANQQLQRSLEDTLNQLSGQEVGVRKDLAQAIYGGKSKVAEANYNQTLAEQAAAEQRRLAAIRGQYDVEQSRIRAEQAIEEARINAENRVVNYPNDSYGIDRYLLDNGIDDPSQFWGTVDMITITDKQNATEAYQAWLRSVAAQNPSSVVKNAARDWFQRQSYRQQRDMAVPDYSSYGVQTPQG